MAKNTAVAKKQDLFPQELPESQVGSNRGNENVSQEDVARPTIKLLQGLSPEVKAKNPAYIEGAVEGMLLNSVSGELYDEVYVVNISFTKSFSVWQDRKLGGQYEGMYSTEAEANAKFEEIGATKETHGIFETHTHICAMIDPETKKVQPIQFMMNRSALGPSRAWNTNIATAGGDRFSSIWKVSGTSMSNSKGDWVTYQTQFAGYAPEDLHGQLAKMYDASH